MVKTLLHTSADACNLWLEHCCMHTSIFGERMDCKSRALDPENNTIFIPHIWNLAWKRKSTTCTNPWMLVWFLCRAKKLEGRIRAVLSSRGEMKEREGGKGDLSCCRHSFERVRPSKLSSERVLTYYDNTSRNEMLT